MTQRAGKGVVGAAAPRAGPEPEGVVCRGGLIYYFLFLKTKITTTIVSKLLLLISAFSLQFQEKRAPCSGQGRNLKRSQLHILKRPTTSEQKGAPWASPAGFLPLHPPRMGSQGAECRVMVLIPGSLRSLTPSCLRKILLAC